MVRLTRSLRLPVRYLSIHDARRFRKTIHRSGLCHCPEPLLTRGMLPGYV